MTDNARPPRNVFDWRDWERWLQFVKDKLGGAKSSLADVEARPQPAVQGHFNELRQQIEDLETKIVHFSSKYGELLEQDSNIENAIPYGRMISQFNKLQEEIEDLRTSIPIRNRPKFNESDIMHGALSGILQADDTSTDTAGGKHVTDALVKKYEDHRNASQNVHGIGAGNAVVGTGTAQTLSSKKFSDGLTIEKTAGLGIKVDLTSPTFGYRDLLGEIKILSPGANDPTLAVFRDSVRAFSFSNAVMNEANFHFHITHDYFPGSDIFLHFHWSQNVVDTGGSAGAPGVVKWQAEVTYAKGHNQAAFPATFTTSVTQTASGTQYQHMLSEVQLSAASPSATQIDSDILEPDGVIIVRAFRDPTDVADTLNQVPFLNYVDVHYQSTSIGTKQRSPNFYA